MSTFLWELACEEIPARMLADALTNLSDLVASTLGEYGLSFGRLETLGTPRRLAVLLFDLAEKQEERQESRRGPPVDRAFDAQGNPTGAASGFAKSCGVTVDLLSRETLGKGVYLVYRETIPGRPVVEVLPSVLEKVVKGLSWPKSMRWGTGEFRFVRPITAMTAVLDGQVLPFVIPQAGSEQGIAAGDTIMGHRFMSPGPHSVLTGGGAVYRDLLRQHKVMVDLPERLGLIRRQVEALAVTVQGQALLDPALLSENACLTEWPVALLGHFDPHYLEIPKEVLVTSMKNHQKYFALVDAHGQLLPCFVAVANIESPDSTVLIQGYQRVLRARLEDAAFFWGEDRKKPLADRLESLKSVVFQARLGTLYDKSVRVGVLARQIALQVFPELEHLAVRAAALCKGDLVSGMVGEFPELQGVMGGYYARHDGEDPRVADAVAEHYRPQGAADALPKTPLGVVLSLADKIDTLVGCFGVGLVPTGAKDPFALRRAALGVIRMTLAGEGLPLPLRQILMVAYQSYDQQGVLLKEHTAAVLDGVLAFFYGRLDPHLRSEGLEYDLIDAVLSLGLDDLYDVAQRARAIARFKGMDSYGSLVAANKRIANILAKAQEDGQVIPPLSPGLLTQSAEQTLYEQVGLVAQQVTLAGTDYGRALDALAGLREAIDNFFETILVMDPDAALRGNRLSLINQVRATFQRVADISRLAPEAG